MKLLIICLSLSFFFGCRTANETSVGKEKKSYIQQNDVMETSDTKIEGETYENAAAQIVENAQIAEKSTTIKWSAPDSSGRQFLVETIVVVKDRNANTTIVTNNNRATEYTATAVFGREEKTENKIETSFSTSTKKQSKPNTPTWMVWGAIIISAGLLVMLYFVLKRFKLIK